MRPNIHPVALFLIWLGCCALITLAAIAEEAEEKEKLKARWMVTFWNGGKAVECFEADSFTAKGQAYSWIEFTLPTGDCAYIVDGCIVAHRIRDNNRGALTTRKQEVERYRKLIKVKQDELSLKEQIAEANRLKAKLDSLQVEIDFMDGKEIPVSGESNTPEETPDD